MYLDFSELEKVRKELEKKGYCMEEALLFVASQFEEDINSGICVERYCDTKSDREVEIRMSVFGRRKK